MESIRVFFTHPTVRKISFILIVILLLYSLRGMLNLLLLVFIVTFVMGSMQRFITKKINRFMLISPILVTVLLYLILIGVMVFSIINYVPRIINQLIELINNITHFLSSTQNDEVVRKINIALEKIDYKTYLGNAISSITKLGKALEVVLFVILLSFFYLLQKKQIVKFTEKFSTSRLSWVYSEIKYYSEIFTASFGKVIEVQLVVAVFNTVMTMLGLWILGFPYLFALTIMVFVLSLIPVAGVIISFIPISIIGYQIDVSLVYGAIIMILIIHSLETYIISPRLYSHKTKLPMFYTFIVLIFAQHYMGIWGLIIGIPIFIFMLEVLGVNTEQDIAGEDKGLNKLPK